VLYLAWAPFFSGAERALSLTLQSLDRSRYVPHVVAGTDGEFVARVRELGITCEVVPLEPWTLNRAIRSSWALARVGALALRRKPAIIHANDIPSFQPGGYAARALKIPAVTHVRFPDSETGYRWFLRPAFSLAIFVSEAARREGLAEAPDVFGDRSAALHDPVLIPALWSDDQRLEARRALALPVDRPLVALVGQVAEIKGIWEFVQAADMLRHSEAHFVVVGDDLKGKGEQRRAMEARVAALGMTTRFHFLGFRSDAASIVQAFDLLVAPSHVEPLGLVSLEAMAGCRPVVATRVGGIPEVVDDGVTGRLVPAKDPRALADGVEGLLHDPGLRERMGRAGRVRAEQHFGLARHGAMLQEIYDRLITPRRG
jgi:glycosyltransferase involved in cell wall biosynthesis